MAVNLTTTNYDQVTLHNTVTCVQSLGSTLAYPTSAVAYPNIYGAGDIITRITLYGAGSTVTTFSIVATGATHTEGIVYNSLSTGSYNPGSNFRTPLSQDCYLLVTPSATIAAGNPVNLSVELLQ